MTIAPRRLAPAILGMACLAASAGEIQVFEHADFRGRSITFRQAVPDLEAFGMNDRISSVKVRRGTWQLCTDADFRGDCATIGVGDYRTVQESLNDRFSSLREVGQEAAVRGEQARTGAGGGSAVLYESEGLQGPAVEIRESTPDLETAGFNDRARSIEVRQGTWIACEHSDFRGDCQTLEPGRHRKLDGKVSGRVSSMRLVAGSAPAAGAPEPAAGWGSGSRAVLYEQPNFGGRALVIDSEVVGDFGRANFNDRAASMRIEGGYWIFCTDAAFGGECRTFGSGDYASLEAPLARRISSGRRIHGR